MHRRRGEWTHQSLNYGRHGDSGQQEEEDSISVLNLELGPVDVSVEDEVVIVAIKKKK